MDIQIEINMMKYIYMDRVQYLHYTVGSSCIMRVFNLCIYMYVTTIITGTAQMNRHCLEWCRFSKSMQCVINVIYNVSIRNGTATQRILIIVYSLPAYYVELQITVSVCISNITFHSIPTYDRQTCTRYPTLYCTRYRGL